MTMMRTGCAKLFCGLVALGWLGVLGPARATAEIAPEQYAALQQNSPERLEIEVLRVDRPLFSFGTEIEVTANARVVTVHSSLTRLQPGDSITVRYTHNRPRRGWVGPRPIPIIERGRRYPAYLEWSSELNCYTPAARGASFEAPVQP